MRWNSILTFVKQVFDENQPDVAPSEVREGIEEMWSGRKIWEEAVDGEQRGRLSVLSHF